MAHGPFHDPEFDFDLFRSTVTRWVVAGGKRIVVEWQTGPGPIVSWYPSGDRQLGSVWRFDVRPAEYSELYADFLECRLMPRLSEIARGLGAEVRILCVDQQPIQIMRLRRRELEHAQQLLGRDAAHA